MGLFGALKGVAARLLPFLIKGGLDSYRKKNPKSGWIVDAVESTLESNEQDISFQRLPPQKKVQQVAKQVRNDFPAMDRDTVHQIARVAVISKMKADKKGA